MCPSAIVLRASRAAMFSACLGFLLFAPSAALAQQIIGVEEDWELVIANPEPDCVSPQITTTMSPTQDLRHHHAVFEINQETLNTFIPGGMQLQVWHGVIPLGDRSYGANTVLRTPGETIRWTQVMYAQGGVLVFDVVNGQSTTWGEFGSGEEGRFRFVVNTWLDGLGAYSPAFSVATCGIGYASNRVTSLKLKCVRYTLSNGQQVVDSTVRTVYPQE